MQFIKDIITRIMEECNASSSFETKIKEPPLSAKSKGVAISPLKSSLKRKLDSKKAKESTSRKKGNKNVIVTPSAVYLAKILDKEAKNIIEVIRSLEKLKKDSSKKKKKTPFPSTRRSSQINASGTFPSYKESQKKGKSPVVIKDNEARESLVLSKKKKVV